ncbi:septal ring lytic transglycosylase RlpA family protein [Thiohalorhabdus methylotrophus]|uniref:Endolytic peptidoglycan transglycosylase RlpA n=1 Tax=Thiohalorhabdus methylotrophus TaxID=3242694 RepID=A0ABV4TXR1_9GAMM
MDAGVPADRSGSHKTTPYKVGGTWYHPLKTARGYNEVGLASWYGSKFHGRPTANGEVFNMHLPTAAHRRLPLPTIARVTNLENGRSTQVRINDRGPFVDTHERIIDLSYGAAQRLGMDEKGLARVRIEALRGPDVSGQAKRQDRPSAKPGARDLYLQVGAFRKEQNASQLKQRLRDLDLDRVVITTGHSEGSRIFRVRMGPLSGVARADQLAQELRSAGFPTGQLVHE